MTNLQFAPSGAVTYLASSLPAAVAGHFLEHVMVYVLAILLFVSCYAWLAARRT